MGAVLEHASLLFGVLMFVSIVSMIFTLEYLDDEVFGMPSLISSSSASLSALWCPPHFPPWCIRGA